jgi:aryl-alcohol dehydrogenase-like predicted oxidoreductase
MADIPTRTLGRTGLEVTVLGFGAMELRGTSHWRGRPLEPSEAERVLNDVLDSGINYIDTSIDYGESEERIGAFIAHRRDEYFLASKCGCLVGAPQPVAEGQRMAHVFTRENIVAGVDQSLKRMKTDHLDLVQLHASPSKETLESDDVLETLTDLRQEGKVRFIGSSSTLPNIDDHIAMGVFDAFQVPYSALQREHGDAITAAAKTGAGIIVRGGVARGVPGEGQGTESTWDAWYRANLDELLNGESRTAFMLRYTLSHPDLDTTIVGTLDRAHLAQNVEVAKLGPLSQEIYDEATARLDGVSQQLG